MISKFERAIDLISVVVIGEPCIIRATSISLNAPFLSIATLAPNVSSAGVPYTIILKS